MTALALAVFLSSAAGSLHCAGMCGGLAAVAAAGGRRGRLLALAAYNGGRLAAYAGLGAAAGGLGRALDLAGALVGFQRAAAVAAGVAIAGWGALGLARALGARAPRRLPPIAAGAFAARALRRVGAGSPVGRALAIGLLTGLLPCGWLWAFVATAAGTGTWEAGALVMAVFWLGTLPMMAGLGAGAGAALGPLRRHAPAVSAVALIAVGLFSVIARAPGSAAPRAPAAHAPSGAAGSPHGHR
jgi:sulfite exporter TauE/SafE